MWHLVCPAFYALPSTLATKLKNIKSGVLPLLAREDASFTPRILACIEHICPVATSTKYPGTGTGDPAKVANAWIHHTQILAGKLDGTADPEKVKKLGRGDFERILRATDCALLRYMDLYFTFLSELKNPSGPSKRIWPWFATAMNDPNPWPGVSLTAMRALFTALEAPSADTKITKKSLQAYGEKCWSTPLWNAVVNYERTPQKEGTFSSTFTTAETGFKDAFNTFVTSSKKIA